MYNLFVNTFPFEKSHHYHYLNDLLIFLIPHHHHIYRRFLENSNERHTNMSTKQTPFEIKRLQPSQGQRGTQSDWLLSH